MAQSHKLSLTTATFINLNVMLGSGIFINSILLAQKAGILGAFTYIIVGILILPLILSMSKLMSIHSEGGFYAYGQQEINPFFGFVSSWSYVVGKLASAVIMTQIAVLLLQSVIIPLRIIPASFLNCLITLLFLSLNLLDTKSNSAIQTAFFWMKTIPIASAIIAGIYLFSPQHLAFEPTDLSGFIIALPLVFFALSGFEAACAISGHIENPTINGPKSLLYSYGLVMFLTTAFQFSLYAGLGTVLEQLPDYRFLFPALVTTIFPAAAGLNKLIIAFLHTAIALSALGGSYSVLFSNNWNVYTLAKNNHLLASKKIIQFNAYHVPYYCVLIEGAIYVLFLIISHGNQLPLQQIAAFGPTISYGISALAAWYAVQRKALNLHPMIPVLAIGSCLLLGSATVYSLIVDGMNSLLLFGALFSIGVAMFVYKKPTI